MSEAEGCYRPQDRTDRIAVIGAGPGGLCAGRWLAAEGIAFDLIERNPDVGGIWDIRFPGSPMYESAHFISSRTLSGFRDFPMPPSYPDYPSHALILQYLHGYAERHGLRRCLELGVGVRAARPAPRSRSDREQAGTPELTPGVPEAAEWHVELQSGEVRRYGGLVLATGGQWVPKVPPLSNGFAGETYHSSAYRSPRQLEGKRVLIVGGGNSGCDIAVDSGTAAQRTFLSLRRGYWFIPKHVFGVPADVFGSRGPHLPSWLEGPVFERLLKVLVGDVTRLGLPAPDHRLFQTHPVLNSQLLHSLAHGDVTVKPDVRELRGRRALFTDGSEEEIDVAIFATGYRRGFPILPETVHREGDVSQLFLNLCHRSHANLFVVGFFEIDAGAFPLLDLQCELVARLVRARRSDPAKAARFERRLQGPAPDFSRGVRFLEVERMRNYVRERPYARYLAAAIRELS